MPEGGNISTEGFETRSIAFVDVEDLTVVGRAVPVASVGAFGCENCGLCGSAVLLSGEGNVALQATVSFERTNSKG